MAVPEIRHGRIHAPFAEKINPNVVSGRKNVCFSQADCGGGFEAVEMPRSPEPGAGRVSPGGPRRKRSAPGWRGRTAGVFRGRCTAPAGELRGGVAMTPELVATQPPAPG